MATIGRSIAGRVSIDWDFDGTGTVESNRLVSARGSMRLAPPGRSITSTSGQVAQMTIELDNSDNRYSPLISAGALYSSISGGKMYRMPILFEVSINGGSSYGAVFTGMLKLPRNRTLAPGQPKLIQLDARGNEERYLNQRLSTTQADFAAFHDDGVTESDIILDILSNDLGLSGSEYAVDGGLYPLDYFWIDEASVTETLWQLAAAAGGRFYCRQDGTFRYENATHWLTASRSTSSQATFTRADFESLTLYYDDNDLASNVRATANLYEQADSGALWEADEPLTVPPGETVTITAELSDPVYEIESVTYTARTAGGTDLSGSITLTRTDYAQRVEMEFENAHATLAAIINGLTITGVSVAVAERVVVTADDTTAFWDNGIYNRKPGMLERSISSPWIQSRAHAQSLADFVRDRQQEPPLFYIVEGVQGDPARQLGDRITINDSELMDSARDAFVVGIDWSYSAKGGFRQTLLGIDVLGTYPYVDSSPGYFVIGTNELGAADDERGRVFY